ncbi:hypothetical protein E0I74_01175 [Rhizobium laguerreae]|uniref:hypothetical protein n=1 Tax=Rhizobium laguerreae TaxID=1076926 RepID=UPI00103D1285|nr:hypothetical protein [Rhizobium laguerreae]TBX82775.1 hypothetical protein E0I74_01175 [Rhizobium laguerreae]
MAMIIEWPSELAFTLERLQPTTLKKKTTPVEFDDGPPIIRPGSVKPGLTGSADFTAAQRKLMYSVINRPARCVVHGEARRMTLLQGYGFFPEYAIIENRRSFPVDDEESCIWNLSYHFMDDGVIA